MSAATEGFSAMISDFDMGGEREERQIVPKSMRQEQENVWTKRPNARAHAPARSRTHARRHRSRAGPFHRRRCARARPTADHLHSPMRASLTCLARLPHSIELLPESARHWCGATRELECEQRRSHDFGRKAAARGERIDGDGRMAKRGDHGVFIGGEIVVRRCCRGARARARGSRNSSRTSCAVSTSFAPSRKSLWQPLENGE